MKARRIRNIFPLILLCLALMLSALSCDRCKKICLQAKKCLAKKGNKMQTGHLSDCEWYCRKGVETRGGGYEEFEAMVKKTCEEKWK